MRHIEARQRQALHHAQHMHGFGGFAAQEATPRRDVEEQVAHLDHRAFGQRRRPRRADQPRCLRVISAA